ncbi:hypothetical protein FB45DRAFT_861861 [Roridomyces roridus]|uniref:Uncharacterized protein n=1 Tax=Roridomyces roridus TaxID=1738132 RepID=A0AAD7FUY4_9AGAR|nr:hypothetical protein FB45DRAFT_861861 [Roridomyces roridus]
MIGGTLLAHTPTLEKLSIIDGDGGTGPPEIPESTAVTQLLRLHTLSFQVDECADILQYLILPALKDLTITLSDDEVWEAPLRSLLARSKCPLRKLHFGLMDWAPARVLEALLASVRLPSVQDLTIRAPDGADDAIGDLFRFMGDTSLLPALESLTIAECEFHVSLPALVEMLQSRMRSEIEGTAKLTSFALSFGPGSGYRKGREICHYQTFAVDDALDALRKLCAQGLKMDIQSEFDQLGENIDLKMVRSFPNLGLALTSISVQIETIRGELV